MVKAIGQIRVVAGEQRQQVFRLHFRADTPRPLKGLLLIPAVEEGRAEHHGVSAEVLA